MNNVDYLPNFQLYLRDICNLNILSIKDLEFVTQKLIGLHYNVVILLCKFIVLVLTVLTTSEFTVKKPLI